MILNIFSQKTPALLKVISSLLLIFAISACAPLETHSEKAAQPPAAPSFQQLRETRLADIDAELNEMAADKAIAAINYADYQNDIDDIWPRMRDQFQLKDTVNNPRLLAELKWYSKHQKYLDRVIQRAEPFLHFILNEAEKRGIPGELALLPIVESAFQAFAYSHGRAAGIWQFIPGTGKIYGLKQNWWYDGRRDVYASTLAAFTYLESLHREFKGDWLLALAAYNSGSGTVRRAIRRNKRKNRAIDFWHLKLPKETQAYVPKLLALKRIVSSPEKHGISLRCVADIPYFERIDPGSQMDLAMAAQLADIDLEKLYQLNPGYNRWATDPFGPHQLLIPVDQVDLFKHGLAQLPPSERIKWKRHKIRNGETLSHIADRYSVAVSNLKRINNIRSNNIRAGKYLMIPVASRKLSDYNLTAYQRKRTLQSIRRKGQGSRVVHIVQPGDTFWDISRKYKISSEKLARWNGMAVRDPLRSGQKLVLWTKQAGIASPRLGGNTIRKISYRVRSGDSLALIAQRFKVAIRDLHRWNTIKGKYIQPGQRLKLYIDITKQSSEG